MGKETVVEITMFEHDDFIEFTAQMLQFDIELRSGCWVIHSQLSFTDLLCLKSLFAEKRESWECFAEQAQYNDFLLFFVLHWSVFQGLTSEMDESSMDAMAQCRHYCAYNLPVGSVVSCKDQSSYVDWV